MGTFLDMEDGDIGFELSGDMLMDSDGDLMMRMGDNMALDLDSGDIHFVSGLSSRDSDDDDE